MFAHSISADVVERLSNAKTFEAGQAIMRGSLGAFELEHFAYVHLPRPGGRKARPLVSTTYSDRWQNHYIESGFISIDPVIAEGHRQRLPFDWRGLDRSTREVRSFFGVAKEHRVGSEGMSFPFRSDAQGCSILSVNSNEKPRAWLFLRKRLLEEFMVVSYYFDAWAKALQAEDSRRAAHSLTARERECLSWCAAGKSLWDISAILGVSERTVRFHLENARFKLDATTTTQCVARAIQCGVIDLP